MRGHIACILARAGLNIIVVARIGFVAGQIATNLLICEARRSLVERTSERIRVWLGGSCFLHVLLDRRGLLSKLLLVGAGLLCLLLSLLLTLRCGLLHVVLH